MLNSPPGSALGSGSLSSERETAGDEACRLNIPSGAALRPGPRLFEAVLIVNRLRQTAARRRPESGTSHGHSESWTWDVGSA